MKRMLLLITFLASAPLTHGMHQAGVEPKAKKQRIVEWQRLEQSIALASQTETEYAHWLTIQDSSIVSLESGNGVVFALPIRIAQQSKTIRDLIEDVGVDNQIPLPNIDTETLAALSRLMQTIDLFQMMREKDELFYIPRALQPVFNQILAQASLELLAKLITAANYLDHPFIMNGVAAIIADRIPYYLREQALRALKKPQSEEESAPINTAQKELNKKGLQTILTLNNSIYPWILKHLTHRTCDISEEYSVADYIKEHGLPEPINKDSEFEFEDLSTISDLHKKGLTSLYGITLLQHRSTVEMLSLEGNCFYDFDLDPQPTKSPFAEFIKLRVLYLNENGLSRLNVGLFKNLINLSWLLLSSNELTELPIDAFVGLDKLEGIELGHNKLRYIKKGAFNGVPNLYHLDLGSNNLRSMEPGTLSCCTHLGALSLEHTSLSAEERDRIIRERNLVYTPRKHH